MLKPNGVITLTTDFGNRDGFVGTMKGVILSIFPDARLVDISHEVPRQDIFAGAMVLRNACPYFPKGTLHLGVIDPGVGTARRAMVAKTNHHFLVLPDNGLISLLDRQEPVREAYSIENNAFFLDSVSFTFHGRDIFAPVAAYLASGRTPSETGPPIQTFQMLDLPSPRPLEKGGFEAEIIYQDVYGNLFTNLEAQHMEGGSWMMKTGKSYLLGPSQSYGMVGWNKPLFLLGSSGYVEIAVNGGHAAEQLKLQVGDRVQMLPLE